MAPRVRIIPPHISERNEAARAAAGCTLPKASTQAPPAPPAVRKPRVNPLMFSGMGMRRWSLTMDRHGGQCCGMKHLYGFPSANVGQTHEDRMEFIREGITHAIQTHTNHGVTDHINGLTGKERLWRTCIEVVLTETQAREWRDSIEECGFKEVFSFRNSNSGSTCLVFLLETNV